MNSPLHDNPPGHSAPPSHRASLRRRDFLRTSLTTIAAAGSIPSWIFPAQAAEQRQPRVQSRPGNNPNWEALERNLAGTVLRPGSAGYHKAIQIRNIRYANTKPAGVAMVAGPRDVATALAWALDNGVELVTRSGGHSFAGYSTTQGLVIDLNGMTQVTVDPRKRILKTFGAATNDDVAKAGMPHNLGLAGGQCPTVGVPGFTLGGGLGFYMRQHGLGIDSLLETEIVTANGRIITASDRSHPELFWALKGGGGGNYGINTSFTFRPFVVPAHVTIFSLTWQGDACAKAFLVFQETLAQASDELGAVAHFSATANPSGPATPTLRIFGQYAGPKEAVEKLLSPVTRASTPATSQIQVENFWEAKTWLAGDVGKPNAFAERSRYFDKPLSPQAVQILLSTLANAPLQTSGFSVETSFFAWGGAVGRVAPDASAFVHRKDLWLQSYDVSWGLSAPKEKIDQLLQWQNRFYEAMAPFSTDRAYQNFVDPLLENFSKAYYASNLPRLVRVKRTYDPKNVFHFAQSIPT